LAGGEHDGRDREARGAGGGAPEASPDRALHGATSACGGIERVWCADFKGWFKSGDGTRIDPLTISDACSRYLLRAQAVEKTDTERVRAIFEAAFREYGLPWWMRTDNGPPFASSAVGGLSRLAVWWIKLGIVPERIEAGHPEQNGRHERMHRTLKLELHPAQDWRGQQRELDRFRDDYNHVRPHEALGMQTPASVYEPSPREYPAKVPEPEYSDAMLVRSVKSHGHFRWKKHDVFLSEVLWARGWACCRLTMRASRSILPTCRWRASTAGCCALYRCRKLQPVAKTLHPRGHAPAG